MPSLYPWHRTPVRGRRRLRDWLRRHLALLLQLLTLFLLALALANPSIRLPVGGGGMVVTVAQPGLNPAPLKAALDGLARQRHALVVAQPHPTLAVEGGDPEAVLAALAEVPASHGGGDLSAALDLAAGLMTGPDARGLILADGAESLPADPRWGVLSPALPDRFRIGPLLAERGADGDSVLYHLAGPPGAEFELLLESGPAGPAAGPGPDARIVRSGRLPESGRLDGVLSGLAGGSRLTLWLSGPDGAGLVSAVIGPPDPARGRVLVEAPDPGPYERAARAAGHPVVGGPDEEFDIAVYVGRLPERLPAAGILLIDPPEEPGFLRRAAASFDLAVADPASRLLAGVPATALAPGAVRALIPPPGAHSHADSSSGSWLWRGRLANRELAVLALDPAPGLSGQAAFPLLLRDLLAEIDPLRPLGESEVVRAGVATAVRPHPRAEALSITDPRGQVVLSPDADPARPIGPDEVGQQITELGVAWRPQSTGLHWIRQTIAGGTVLRSPVWVQAVEPAFAPSGLPAPLDGGATRRVLDLWPILAGLAVAVLLAEWAWFNRRRGAV